MATMPMILFRLITEQTSNAINKQAKDNPYAIEHGRSLEDIQYRRPQLFQRGIIVEDCIDVQAHAYDETHEQRQQLKAYAAGRNVYVRHL